MSSPAQEPTPTAAPTTRVAPLPLRDVTIDDAFWSPRIETVRKKTLPFQHQQLLSTGRMDALRLQWRPGDDPVPHIFWDSDIAKWIEAASYSLTTQPDPKLEAQVDEAIELLAAAQQPDGYLNSYFSVVAPDQRFTDLRDAHELYCAGHLIEAAVAHVEATGKRTLLDVVCHYTDLIEKRFGREPGQLRGYDGHEEIELALVKLYRVTGEDRYLRLGQYFVDERGQRPFFFDEETERRGTPGFFGDHFRDRDENPEKYREYMQSHLPVREQTEAVGHSVRAMYLYCAMADLAVETGDESLLAACRTLWRHLTTRRMYVTGGIGSTAEIEGFTEDYDLPNESAYAETCAAIGLVLWASRMTHIDRNGAYVDVLERALYNGVLSGVALDGERFFYDNPLASRGGVERHEWFDVACCPPNIARLLTSLGRYLYSAGPEELVVHLYAAGTARFAPQGVPVVIEQRGGYPWDGEVRFTVRTDTPVEFALSLRMPGWSAASTLTVANDAVDLAVATVNGYASVRRQWADGDEVVLQLELAGRREYAHPAVAADAGAVALTYGPFVYCVEEADNGPALHDLALPRAAALDVAPSPAGLAGVTALTAAGRRHTSQEADPLYSTGPWNSTDAQLVAAPYYAWANRGAGEMRVWVREEAG
ncbi:MAG TPA: beta-L-arabinofuranosidase domain-containing protein [Actinomycetales bacterium]|nr:beta-L-arabinofuranosidase domain-containing protein [Actinomycetales bacterium]